MTTNKMEQNEIDLRIRLRELASQRGWDNFEVRDLQDKVIENVLDDFVFFYEEGKADGIKIQILNEVHTPADLQVHAVLFLSRFRSAPFYLLSYILSIASSASTPKLFLVLIFSLIRIRQDEIFSFIGIVSSFIYLLVGTIIYTFLLVY